jgi:anhydro-N-acetylmuramic acid kinase
MKLKNSYRVIGLMSGTSLDGLDVAYCNLIFKNKKWKAEIISAITIKYDTKWRKKLSTAQLLSGEELMTLHAEYGIFIGECCRDFIKTQKIKTLDFIASHGHTIFHQPQKNFTFQLGDGNQIHSITNVPVVFDFRSLDVANGGEGAPLVPIGDRYLFADFDICLNLGGIANLSMETKGNRKAFDICFANMGLNYLMNKLNKEFDAGGGLASTGEVNEKLLKQLRTVYRPLRKKRPSLGREGFEQWMQPLLDREELSLADRLRTFCESIAEEIDLAIPSSSRKLKMIATGGGASNIFFMFLLAHRMKSKVSIVVPERKIIEFKEALVFALLGVLRVRNEVNALKSVTGARKDSSSGIIVGM